MSSYRFYFENSPALFYFFSRASLLLFFLAGFICGDRLLPYFLFSHMDATCHLRSVETASKEGAEVGQAGAGLLKLPQAPPGYKRLDLSAGLRSQHHTARGKQLRRY